MRKILFVINNMDIGGIQKSLLELLKCLNRDYDITVFCVKSTGKLLESIPTNIPILFGNKYALISEQTVRQAKESGIVYGILRAFLSAWSKLFGKGIPAFVLTQLMGQIEGSYDIAISYSQPINDKEFCALTNEIVLNCCNAREKATFVHCDFGSYGGNTKYNKGLYTQFDKIAAVSDSVGQRFKNLNLELSEKVYTVRNCCDIEQIRLLAEQNSVIYENPAIVTVARLSKEKGLIRCIPIWNRLKNEGLKFEWHIIGDGNIKEELLSHIKEHSLEEYIFLHGEQTNPYRFIKNADYLLLPSYHEAAPMVFDEALCLRVPVLTTRTLSADELVGIRNVGKVCDNEDEAIYAMLKEALYKNDHSGLSLDLEPNNDAVVKQFDCICRGKQFTDE